MFKSLTCKHYYKLVSSKDEWTGKCYHTYNYIYCPKCDKERKVTVFDWELIRNKQIIKKEYIEEEKND